MITVVLYRALCTWYILSSQSYYCTKPQVIRFIYHMCVCVCVCARVRVCVRACACVCVRARVHATHAIIFLAWLVSGWNWFTHDLPVMISYPRQSSFSAC
jgi:hypothetical protein